MTQIQKYTNIIDRRDNPTLPTDGGFLKTSVEASGLGGDAKLFRVDSNYLFTKTFMNYFVRYFKFISTTTNKQELEKTFAI